MRLQIDNEADALYLTLGDADVVGSEEIVPGVIVDYDETESVVGVEVLYLSQRAAQSDQASPTVAQA